MEMNNSSGAGDNPGALPGGVTELPHTVEAVMRTIAEALRADGITDEDAQSTWTVALAFESLQIATVAVAVTTATRLNPEAYPEDYRAAVDLLAARPELLARFEERAATPYLDPTMRERTRAVVEGARAKAAMQWALLGGAFVGRN